MAVTPQEEAQAQKVVDESKRTAHVDTGALRRSIHYTVAKGGIVFRQLFYGQYNDNSQLIENAARMMRGTPYIIEELDENGNLQKRLTKLASGRIRTSPEPKQKGLSSNKAKDLITKILAKRDKEEKEKEAKKKKDNK